MKEQDIHIVEAGIGDLDALMQWRIEVLRHVFSLPEDADTSKLETENRKYYMREIPRGGHIACFAKIGDETAGCGGVCIYNEMPSPDNAGGKCAYLMNIYCREQYRGQGVGRRVVRWLIGKAIALGITKIYLETSESGRNLYTRLGFKDMKDMMYLDF